MSFRRLTSLFLLPLALLSLTGCDFYFGPDSEALRSMRRNINNIQTLIKDASEGNVYQNEDLDLDVMASEVKKLNKSYSEVAEQEASVARTLYTSANLFYLFETFERHYYQSEPDKMKETKGDVLEFLLDENLKPWVDERGGQDKIDALIQEMNNFITIEEKYLDPSLTPEEFQVFYNKANSGNLFDLFYTFIDQTVLFGSQGVELAGYGKKVGEE